MMVQPNCLQVAIYADDDGNVEVCQERAWNEDADTIITIERRNAGLAARAILNAAGMVNVEFYRRDGALCYDYDPENPEGVEAEETREGDHPSSKLKDPTAAERMRRYRNKHRNGNRNVTEEPRLIAAE